MAMIRNLSVMGLANLFGFVLSFGSVLIVSRVLTPMEIGVFSVSVAFVGLAHLLRDFGVGSYLVQAKEVSRESFAAAFSATLYSSWFLALLLYSSKGFIAELYDHQGIADLLTVLSINFLILPFATPILAMLRREMKFKHLAASYTLESFVQASVTVGLALAGESYMSMAWGSLIAHISKLILLNIMRPGEIFVFPKLKGLSEVLKFGSISSITSVVKELGASAPDFIFGRTLGFVEVALFSRAVGLKRMLIERLINLVRGVHFPSFAKELRQGGDGAELYCRNINYMVAVIAPVLAVLATLAEPLIHFLFGSQWSDAARISTYICTFSILTAPYCLYGLSLVAGGYVTLNMKAEVAIQACHVSILLTSLVIEMEVVAMLLVISYLFEAMISQFALHRAFELSFGKLISSIRGSLLLIPCSVVGPMLTIFASNKFDFAEHKFIILSVSGILAVVGWLLGIWVLEHVLKKDIIKISHTVTRRVLGEN